MIETSVRTYEAEHVPRAPDALLGRHAPVPIDSMTVVAAAFGSREAHVPLDRATAGLSEAVRGRRPEGYPHSPWELLVRVAQADLIAFVEDPAYEAPEWPCAYWPASPVPPSPDAWAESVVAAFRRDRERLRAIALRLELDLSSAIPLGGGQMYLRTLLLAADHAAYHIGRIVAVRRMLGAWPSA